MEPRYWLRYTSEVTPEKGAQPWDTPACIKCDVQQFVLFKECEA